MNRIAFVVQRYGLEINGGAEYHCRLLAEKLSNTYQVEVLTSAAADYITWDNFYLNSEEEIGGVLVRRFKVPFARMPKKFRRQTKLFYFRRRWQKILKIFGLHNLALFKPKEKDNYNWLKYQGPYLPSLTAYLAANKEQYNAIIFFTYLYYPTAVGIDTCKDKAILIPTAHDEPPIYLPVFENLFAKPKAILYNTIAEKKFVKNKFHNVNDYEDVVGVGIDQFSTTDDAETNRLIDELGHYFIYVGRIDASKGCKIMCDFFIDYVVQTKQSVKLVMVGQAFMEIPKHEAIVPMGFLPESQKKLLLQRAKALIMPSFYESLSMVTLESMAAGTPILVNEKCEVLKDHVVQSQSGLLFNNAKSFNKAIDYFLSKTNDLNEMVKNGEEYVQRNYAWAAVLDKVEKAISFVSSRK